MADWSKFFDIAGETVQQTFGTSPGSIGNRLRDAEIARGNALAKKAETLESRTVDALQTDFKNHFGLFKTVHSKLVDALATPPTLAIGGGGDMLPETDLTQLRTLWVESLVRAEAKRAAWYAKAGIDFTPVSFEDYLGDAAGSGIAVDVLGEMVTDSLKAEEGGASILSYAKDIQEGKTVNLEGNIESIKQQFVKAQNAARVEEQLPHMSDAEVELFLNKKFSEETIAKLKQAIRKAIVNRLVSGGLTGSQRAPGDEYESNLSKTRWEMERQEFQDAFPSPLNENPLYIERGLVPQVKETGVGLPPQAGISPDQGMLTQKQMIAEAEQEAIQRQSNFPQWLEMLRRRAAA